jgi:hypothetical protein
MELIVEMSRVAGKDLPDATCLRSGHMSGDPGGEEGLCYFETFVLETPEQILTQLGLVTATVQPFSTVVSKAQ